MEVTINEGYQKFVHNQGWDAYENGKSVTTNPYSGISAESITWTNGWEAAQKFWEEHN